MPRRKPSQTRNRKVALYTLLGLFCVSLPWLLPGCEFETHPTKVRHHNVWDGPDDDGGE